MSPMWFRRGPRTPPPGGSGPDVRVAIVANQVEGEMLQGILAEAGIQSYLRRNAAFDVPDMLAGGPRDLMVRGADALAAHALLDPMEPMEPADGSDGS